MISIACILFVDFGKYPKENKTAGDEIARKIAALIM